jgi:chlorobactene glucosyltransferase
MSSAWALLATAPWVLIPPAVMLRVSTRSRSLGEHAEPAPSHAPLVSVIIPARNEARNIARCVRSVLASRYPALEVLVVDDHSTDDTAAVARSAVGADERLRIIATSELPNGWFGKQWACTTGAHVAQGELLLFTDADTEHSPDLLPRAVNALYREQADLLSVAGRQEMRSFWERMLQPQVFWMLVMRYGGTESVNRARRAEDVIANGQFILIRRSTYESVGGHEAVRDKVAEDLALAQLLFRRGFRVRLFRADDQLSTHMYASLSELVAGWGKNVFAGGIHAMPGGALGRALFPFVLPLAPAMTLAPFVVLAVASVLGGGWLLWSAICAGASVVWWTLIYRGFQQRVWYALLTPLAAAMLLFIIARAIVRGRRVGWKGREYLAR